MALNVKEILQNSVISLDTIDSTNNYAMQLIDDDKAHTGLTIVARQQTAGKGQRGNMWVDKPGESLLMSIIIVPEIAIEEQFGFNATVAVAIADVLKELNTDMSVSIKWPNDIIINDKKAGGILIENVFRGSKWSHSVIGLGLNVLQPYFPEHLPNATSLFRSTGLRYDISELMQSIRRRIIENIYSMPYVHDFFDSYNKYLFKKNQLQAFTDGIKTWNATVLSVNHDGQLKVRLNDNRYMCYTHGVVSWKW